MPTLIQREIRDTLATNASPNGHETTPNLGSSALSSKTLEAEPGKGIRWNHPARGVIKIVDREAGLAESYMLDGETLRKKVAIVGFATSSRERAPFNDPEWDIWGLNQLYRHIPRADRWFEIHADWNDAVVEGTDHEGWLRNCPIPVYMTQTHPNFPTSMRYPIERAVDTFSDYFTSTIAFMTALAILEDFEEIALYGIDLIVGGEYFFEKACAEYLLGFANGRGKTVRLPIESALCKSLYRYGYQKEPDWGPLSYTVLQTREQDLKSERNALVAKAHTIDGALTEAVRVVDAVPADFAGRADLEARVAELRRQRNEMIASVHSIEGAVAEAGRWREFLELHLRGAKLYVPGSVARSAAQGTAGGTT